MTATDTTITPPEDCPARLLYRAGRERAAEVDARITHQRAEQARAAAECAASDATYWAPGIAALADPDSWTGYPETIRDDGTPRPAGAATHLGDDIWAWSTDDDRGPLATLMVRCTCGSTYRSTAIHGHEDVDHALALAYDARDHTDRTCRTLHT
ncbi:hypothetical protein [Embleya hyalina]|uniref:Uncharacterized protein n=1 Tax=Embleya hyalina TaxID=516124 RepID=A0A401YYX1_9ACTN|nr:hypothetical protein [Embleya hyalina]GCD99750.1 hypothetical protein EHYA_07472 [Embleya hyalina]